MKFITTQFLLLLVLILLSACQTFQSKQSETALIFDIQSSVWVNLHHYLHNEAFRSEKASQPMQDLSAKEKEQMAKVIQFYQLRFQGRDLLFDDGMTAINTRLSEAQNSENLNSINLPEDLRSNLESGIVIYKKHLWQRQNQENLTWIRNTKDLLKKYGVVIQKNLEDDLQRKFSDGAYRIDVVHESNWSGAYTYSPPHTVISSGRPSYSDLASLEMIFHESLHAGPFEKVQAALNQEFSKMNLKDEDQLWHAVLFFTAGEVVRNVLKENGIEYTPYAYKNGLFAPERKWAKFEPSLRKYWQPYLTDQIDMAKAISGLVRAAVPTDELSCLISDPQNHIVALGDSHFTEELGEVVTQGLNKVKQQVGASRVDRYAVYGATACDWNGNDNSVFQSTSEEIGHEVYTCDPGNKKMNGPPKKHFPMAKDFLGEGQVPKAMIIELGTNDIRRHCLSTPEKPDVGFTCARVLAKKVRAAVKSPGRCIWIGPPDYDQLDSCKKTATVSPKDKWSYTRYVDDLRNAVNKYCTFIDLRKFTGDCEKVRKPVGKNLHYSKDQVNDAGKCISDAIIRELKF